MFPMINPDFKHVWYITHDFITRPGDRDDHGTAGPSAATMDLLEAIEQDKTPAGYVRHTYRLYDDDGELYYRGRMLMPEEAEGDEEHLVAPLDDFGTPNAGCTYLKWDNNPTWDIG